MQIEKTKHLKICEDLGKMKEWRFKRPQKTLHREELCPQIPRYLIWKQTQKKKKNEETSISALTCGWTHFFAPRHMLWRLIKVRKTQKKGGLNYVCFFSFAVFFFFGLTTWSEYEVHRFWCRVWVQQIVMNAKIKRHRERNKHTTILY